MSLRDKHRATHAVQVVLREMRPGKRGVDVPVETGRVTVFGRLQEVSSEDVTALAAAGERGVLTMRRFYCRNFPGDSLSQVIDDAGALHNVVGEPKRHRGSQLTARDVVLLRQAGEVHRGENL